MSPAGTAAGMQPASGKIAASAACLGNLNIVIFPNRGGRPRASPGVASSARPAAATASPPPKVSARCEVCVAVPPERPRVGVRSACASGAAPWRSLDPERMRVDDPVFLDDQDLVGRTVVQRDACPWQGGQRGLARERAAGRRAERVLRAMPMAGAAFVGGPAHRVKSRVSRPHLARLRCAGRRRGAREASSLPRRPPCDGAPLCAGPSCTARPRRWPRLRLRPRRVRKTAVRARRSMIRSPAYSHWEFPGFTGVAVVV